MLSPKDIVGKLSVSDKMQVESIVAAAEYRLRHHEFYLIGAGIPTLIVDAIVDEAETAGWRIVRDESGVKICRPLVA